MLLKPTKNNILIQSFPPTNDTGLVLPDGKASAASTDRVKHKILEVSKAVEVAGELAPGNFVYLRPNYNFLVIDEPNYVAIIDASVVEAIVLDDKE